ncbi:hypothetical protein Agabi119p4_9225 [Agaricus bisporus var. burnettii]|uniref:Uncharacterized protein n=1 Tax=Agaricus bisporus var. burnettii TaxID=192524 RepID=A0A8H7C4Y0_AGABI|nr:hypothetical protein Agabi119p4_9225 [Agaricus bisporus var. burnettii]
MSANTYQTRNADGEDECHRIDENKDIAQAAVKSTTDKAPADGFHRSLDDGDKEAKAGGVNGDIVKPGDHEEVERITNKLEGQGVEKGRRATSKHRHEGSDHHDTWVSFQGLVEESSKTSGTDNAPKRNHVPAGQGKSKSSILAQKKLKAYREGKLNMTHRALEDWRNHLRADDPYVEFNHKNLYRVRHSPCGKWFRVKGPLDLTRWRKHLKGCISGKQRKKKAAGIRTLQSMGFFTKTPGPAKRAKTTTTPVSIPCVGLSGIDDPRIKVMLKQGINECVYELALAQLKDLDYKGLVCVACDDTKLFSAFWLFWDMNTKLHYLIGGIKGPILVEDPDDLEDLLQVSEKFKATKLRLWTLTISRPKTTPIILAALPVGNRTTANTLAEYSLELLRGLIQVGIEVVSYACDGAEVERRSQRITRDQAENKLEYTIPNPRHSGKDISIEIPIIDGQPVCLIQDSKHALKTFCNNLFSGARLLVLGNHVAGYSHIHQVAYHTHSPLYRRDVERLDRQDDNAATYFPHQHWSSCVRMMNFVPPTLESLSIFLFLVMQSTHIRADLSCMRNVYNLSFGFIFSSRHGMISFPQPDILNLCIPFLARHSTSSNSSLKAL